jgi:magnesium chelatase subunit H
MSSCSRARLAGVELAYQNLDSVELGVTDIDHYVDALGGMSRSVTRARGSAAPDLHRRLHAGRDQGPHARRAGRSRDPHPDAEPGLVRRHAEAWLRGRPQHREPRHQHMGWSATTGEVAPWVYQRIGETFVLDADMRERLATLNPKSAARVANRLIEASDRKYWAPDAATLAALHAASDELEDRLEGVTAVAA